MAKYVIEIPDDRLNDYVNGRLSDYELLIPVQVGLKERTHSYGTGLIMSPYTEPDERKIKDKIEDEVWEFAKMFIHPNRGGLSVSEKADIYGHADSDSVLLENSYSEAKAKYDTWKKKKDEIRVGDEVRPRSGGWEGTVIAVDDGDLTIIDVNGKVAKGYKSRNFIKIGRHFPQIAELLEKMKEES